VTLKNPSPRKVTVEAQKAETHLLRFDDKTSAEHQRHVDALGEIKSKRAAYIQDLPDDVRSVLMAANVIAIDEAGEA
jgi:hypothetical protein